MTLDPRYEETENLAVPRQLSFPEVLEVPEDVESNTWSPGTVYQLDKDRYALTLDQDETTVTYLVINKGQSVTKTHEEFRADIAVVEGET